MCDAIKDLLLKATSAHRSGDLGLAENLYRSIIERQPANSTAHHNLGVLMFKRDMNPDACVHLLKAKSLSPDSAKYWTSAIAALLKLGRLDEAESLIGDYKIENRDPSNIVAMELQLQKLKGAGKNDVDTSVSRKGRKEAKKKELKQGKGLRPMTALEAEQVINALNARDDRLALSLSVAMCKKYPKHPLGWKIRAVLCERSGNLKDAIRYNQRAIKIDPTDDETHCNLGIVLKKSGRFLDAERSYLKSLKYNPRNFNAGLYLGVLLRVDGRLEASAKHLRGLIAKFPMNTEALQEFGNTLLVLGNTSEAETCFIAALEQDQNNTDLLFSLGKSLYTQGKMVEAEKRFLKAVEINGDKDARLALAVLLYESKRFERAVGHFSQLTTSHAQSYLLRCYYDLRHEGKFYKQLDRLSQMGALNATIGSYCDRANLRFGRSISNPFVESPFDYVFKTNLKEACDFDKIFVNFVAEVTSEKNLNRKSQTLLTNGYQTAGNILASSSALAKAAENKILEEVEIYRSRFKSSDSKFINRWPKDYYVNAWIINMSSGGSLRPHIHESGWLGGAVYIHVPSPVSENEGSFVVCMDSAEESPESEIPEKIVNVTSGDIVLFPASLLHYTIPFESAENRIVLAFDIIPKVTAQ